MYGCEKLNNQQRNEKLVKSEIDKNPEKDSSVENNSATTLGRLYMVQKRKRDENI